jgi:hypothetical protein
MPERSTQTDQYLRELNQLIGGSCRDRTRLAEEIAMHIADAVQAGVSEASAIEGLGNPHEVATSWRTRCDERCTALRRRMTVALTLAGASAILGVTQHADGGQVRPLPNKQTPRCQNRTDVATTRAPSFSGASITERLSPAAHTASNATACSPRRNRP